MSQLLRMFVVPEPPVVRNCAAQQISGAQRFRNILNHKWNDCRNILRRLVNVAHHRRLDQGGARLAEAIRLVSHEAAAYRPEPSSGMEKAFCNGERLHEYHLPKVLRNTVGVLDECLRVNIELAVGHAEHGRHRAVVSKLGARGRHLIGRKSKRAVQVPVGSGYAGQLIAKRAKRVGSVRISVGFRTRSRTGHIRSSRIQFCNRVQQNCSGPTRRRRRFREQIRGGVPGE